MDVCSEICGLLLHTKGQLLIKECSCDRRNGQRAAKFYWGSIVSKEMGLRGPGLNTYRVMRRVMFRARAARKK
jgi:hypothetical protein